MLQRHLNFSHFVSKKSEQSCFLIFFRFFYCFYISFLNFYIFRMLQMLKWTNDSATYSNEAISFVQQGF